MGDPLGETPRECERGRRKKKTSREVLLHGEPLFDKAIYRINIFQPMHCHNNIAKVSRMRVKNIAAIW